MRFTTTSVNPDGVLTGVLAYQFDNFWRFCTRYKQVSTSLIDPDNDRFLPVFCDESALQSPAHRRLLDCSDQPEIMSAMTKVANIPYDEANVIVLLPPHLADENISDDEMAKIVVMDAATWSCDTTGFYPHLDWAGRTIFRTAVAARLLHAAEVLGLIRRPFSDLGFEELAAMAMADLSSKRFKENSEALLAKEVPGLATLLRRIIDTTRKEIVPSVPVNLGVESENARMALNTLLRINGYELKY